MAYFVLLLDVRYIHLYPRRRKSVTEAVARRAGPKPTMQRNFASSIEQVRKESHHDGLGICVVTVNGPDRPCRTVICRISE